MTFVFQLQYKEAEGRDGSFTETPGTPKVRKLVFLGSYFIRFILVIVQAYSSSCKPRICGSEHTDGV